MSLRQQGQDGALVPAVSVTCLTTDCLTDWEDWAEAVWLTLTALALSGQQP